MAKVLRTHHVRSEDLVHRVWEEILFLTRGVACPECVEILFESNLYRRLLSGKDVGALNFTHPTGGSKTVMGFKYREVHGPGARPGSMAVLIRSEVVFK